MVPQWPAGGCRSGGSWSVPVTLSTRHGPSSRRVPVTGQGDVVRLSSSAGALRRPSKESRATWALRTQRQGSDLAIERTTPCLLGLYSLVALLAHGLYLDGRLAVRQSAWYAKEQATFSDALAALRQHLWKVEYFSTSTPDTEWVEIPRVYLQGLMQSACYTH